MHSKTVQVTPPVHLPRRRTGREPRGLPEPTDSLPGSPEKVAILAERARLRQQLFHPDDAAHPDL